MKFRFLFLVIVFTVLFSVLVFNLYNIQVRKGNFYVASAKSQLENSGALHATRGGIYFTNKESGKIPAAIEKEYFEIFAVPDEIEDPVITAEKIFSVVSISKSDLINLFKKPKDKYELLVKRASEEQKAFIRNNFIKEIYLKSHTERFYPLEKTASHLLGFAGVSKDSDNPSGLYGLEKFFNEKLSGKDGFAKGDGIISPVSGEDIFLNIDRNIESQAEEILSDLVLNFKAQGGSAIVSDPKNGKILAMASLPNFNPNNYSKYPIQNFLNPATEKVYEPGSIFKVITMAIGLDSDSITPETTYVDKGSLTINGSTIKNWDLKAHGRQTMTNVIEQSLNTGAVFAEEQIGRSIFLEYLKKFGLGEISGISLSGEVRGNIKSLEINPKDINFATASFGQGISVTPVSLLKAVSVIANGGNLVDFAIVQGEEDKNPQRIISEDAARKTITMMISAVDKALVAKIEGYNIAGKTGTAQVPDFVKGGYTKDVINTYIGFAPAYDPKFIILIKLDKPAGAPLAGQTVVPAFRKLAEFIINYYNIPPDRTEEKSSN
ncbi:MAG: hypothetical protein A2430_01350 [Candidatus Liptonbacteria bacterium RIFOXYC1_FULL_36_8]|uniref:Penicillin-binding protein transpeptidase domain-containing protein n=3 Tax=Candidatus Liptoniibacteriota TaxID=1817909 RepID=A0A1G2CLG5_9BACT|nr:MAG: hypothetical protein A2390_00480 [Candidatus Liptonbacteria bacterium RIFOXYB1_FULL_36_10]OGZ03923.1 MAG: hypothetical protein A2604_03120 [Candidatus Liptonbacteria bacterium RIFOXYD1_FULL_36_11]OGZ04341.1 MAG: hypothetical protein A2430_01350 [Candidatus Liptonbacteria bacterium RIFOXYC1_FULL_36_8]